MAKEKKEKKIKTKDGNGKSVLMIGVILIVCAIILSGVSGAMLIKAMNQKNKVIEVVKEPGDLPLARIESYETDNIVLQLSAINDPEKVMNFTFYVGFMLDNESKEIEATETLLTDKKNIIKSKITGLLNKKSVEEMLRPDSQDIISAEILEMMKELLETDALVNVYIRDFLYR